MMMCCQTHSYHNSTSLFYHHAHTNDNTNLNSNFLIRYFTEEKVINRVPDVFLLMGGTYFGMQLIGCLMIDKPSKTEEVYECHWREEEQCSPIICNHSKYYYIFTGWIIITIIKKWFITTESIETCRVLHAISDDVF